MGETIDVLGPFCHGSQCYNAQGSEACESIQGADINGVYCLTGYSVKSSGGSMVWLYVLGGILLLAGCVAALMFATKARKRDRGHSVFSQHGSFLESSARVEMMETPSHWNSQKMSNFSGSPAEAMSNQFTGGTAPAAGTDSAGVPMQHAATGESFSTEVPMGHALTQDDVDDGEASVRLPKSHEAPRKSVGEEF